MRFTAPTLDLLKLELERAFDALLDPQQPTKLWSAAQADLPPAANWPDHIVFVTDLSIAAVSDGVDWIGLDDGSPI